MIPAGGTHSLHLILRKAMRKIISANLTLEKSVFEPEGKSSHDAVCKETTLGKQKDWYFVAPGGTDHLCSILQPIISKEGEKI